MKVISEKTRVRRIGKGDFVMWSDWGEDIEVAIPRVLMIKFECPRDSHDLEIDIGEKSGSDDIECDGCGMHLEVVWSDWGEDIEVILLEYF